MEHNTDCLEDKATREFQLSQMSVLEVKIDLFILEKDYY